MSKGKKIILIIWPTLVFAFFHLRAIPPNVCKLTQSVTIFLTLIYLIRTILKPSFKTTYPFIVKMLFISTIASMCMSYIQWGQSLMLSFRVTCTQLSLIYFFLLYKWRPPLQFVEKIIIGYGILNLTLWTIGFFSAPTPIFGGGEEELLTDDRGVYRVNVAGYAFFILLFFYTIVKFKATKHYLWLFISLAFYIVIVLHVVRQIIVFTFITAFLYLVWRKKIFAILASIIIYCSLTFIPFDKIIDSSPVLSSMVSLTERQLESQEKGVDDVRVRAYKYFFTEFPTTPLTAIFGNGTPHMNSPFGSFAQYFLYTLHMHPSDVGYAAIYNVLGLLGMIIYFCMLRMVILQSIPERWMYAKLLILYEIPANIAASWYFQDMLAIVICLYIFYRLKEEHKSGQLQQL